MEFEFYEEMHKNKQTRSKFRIFKRFEIEMTHLVSLLSLLSSVRIRLLLEPLRSRFGEFSTSSYTYQYNSKTKTRQNGFVMALKRTADNKRNNADYMRNNLSNFYFKYLRIKNGIQNVFCLFSYILQ